MNIRTSSHPEGGSSWIASAIRGTLAVTCMALLLAGCGMRPNPATATLAPPARHAAHASADATGAGQPLRDAAYTSPADVGVATLLADARAAYAAHDVVAPAGHNAMEYYEAVLAQDPGNSVATDALREIFPFAVPCVEQAIARHDLSEANHEIAVLAKADPTNYSLTLLRSRLDASVSGNAHVLTITATTDSWVRIVAAGGNVVDARMLHAGESRIYHSAGPLRVTLGNADGVIVTGDGQRLDPGQHPRNQVAHLLVFAPNTLASAARRAHRADSLQG